MRKCGQLQPKGMSSAVSPDVSFKLTSGAVFGMFCNFSLTAASCCSSIVWVTVCLHGTEMFGSRSPTKLQKLISSMIDTGKPHFTIKLVTTEFVTVHWRTADGFLSGVCSIDVNVGCIHPWLSIGVLTCSTYFVYMDSWMRLRCLYEHEQQQSDYNYGWMCGNHAAI